MQLNYLCCRWCSYFKHNISIKGLGRIDDLCSCFFVCCIKKLGLCTSITFNVHRETYKYMSIFTSPTYR